MISHNVDNIFNRSGLASLSDLKSPVYQSIFAQLEKEQEAFLDKETDFRSEEYKWPHDPLHQWSRVWEYPYVYYHFANYLKTLSQNPPPIIADIGSGVTFFPFSLAKLGYQVVCTDIDPICKKDLSSAIKSVSHSPGRVEFRLINNSKLPLEDGECNAVYCISVLEHIPEFENTLTEMARVLKPGGPCLLTCDMDMNPLGNTQFNVAQYERLLSVIGEKFCLFWPDQTIHPVNVLTTKNSLYPILAHPLGFLRNGYRILKQRILKPLLGRKPDNVSTTHLCVLGLALKRKGDIQC